jgi:transglutaminase superfamily protein
MSARASSLASRAGAFMAFLGTPADAALFARMFAWRLCLPGLKYALPLPRLARLMSVRARGDRRWPARERRILALTERLYEADAFLAADDDCLERSLLTYRYLARAGADPRLVVGMREAARDPRGHAWVTVDGRPVTDTEELVDSFAPIVSFGAGGTRQAEPAARRR